MSDRTFRFEWRALNFFRTQRVAMIIGRSIQTYLKLYIVARTREKSSAFVVRRVRRAPCRRATERDETYFFSRDSSGTRVRNESGDSVPNAEVFALVSSRPVRPCFSIFFFFLPFPTRYKRESLSCERTSNTNTANRCFACCAAYRTIGAITFRIYVIIVFV